MNLAQFQTSLDALQARKPVAPATAEHKKLVAQTRKWVGLTFFAPLLKQMREDPLNNKIMDGGRGGEAFSSMYDQTIAEHLSRGGGNKLVNGIVRRLEQAKAAYAKQANLKEADLKEVNVKQGSAVMNKTSAYDPNTDKEGADRMPGAGMPTGRIAAPMGMIPNLLSPSLTVGNAYDATAI